MLSDFLQHATMENLFVWWWKYYGFINNNGIPTSYVDKDIAMVKLIFQSFFILIGAMHALRMHAQLYPSTSLRRSFSAFSSLWLAASETPLLHHPSLCPIRQHAVNTCLIHNLFHSQKRPSHTQYSTKFSKLHPCCPHPCGYSLFHPTCITQHIA